MQSIIKDTLILVLIWGLFSWGLELRYNLTFASANTLGYWFGTAMMIGAFRLIIDCARSWVKS